MNSTPDAARIAAAAKRLGRVLGDEEARLLSVYLGLLVKWNSRMNLVGPSTWPDILETLIQAHHVIFQFLENVFIKFFTLFLHHTMEYRGFNIS